MNMNRLLHHNRHHRTGSVLVGCLVALAIALVLLIAGGIFLMLNWRSWTAAGATKLLTGGLDQTQISQVEKDEIIAHIDTLMARFKDKDVTFKQLAEVVKEITESPLLPAFIVGTTYEKYFSGTDLGDEIKADAQVQLARVAQGVYDDDLDIEDLETILKPIEAPAGTMGTKIQFGNSNHKINLKDPSDVTNEELIELVANARGAADAAEVVEVPEPIDFSDEVAIAIAKALGEDPMLWLPEGVEYTPDPIVDEVDKSSPKPNDVVDDATDDASDDGP